MWSFLKHTFDLIIDNENVINESPKSEIAIDYREFKPKMKISLIN